MFFFSFFLLKKTGWEGDSRDKVDRAPEDGQREGGRVEDHGVWAAIAHLQRAEGEVQAGDIQVKLRINKVSDSWGGFLNVVSEIVPRLRPGPDPRVNVYFTSFLSLACFSYFKFSRQKYFLALIFYFLASILLSRINFYGKFKIVKNKSKNQ